MDHDKMRDKFEIAPGLLTTGIIVKSRNKITT